MLDCQFDMTRSFRWSRYGVAAHCPIAIQGCQAHVYVLAGTEGEGSRGGKHEALDARRLRDDVSHSRGLPTCGRGRKNYWRLSHLYTAARAKDLRGCGSRAVPKNRLLPAA